MNRFSVSLFLFLLMSFESWGQNGVTEVVLHEEGQLKSIYLEPDLTEQGWNLLPEVRFWRQVMRLQPDSCILNIAKTREVLFVFPTIWYDSLSRKDQLIFKDSVRAKLSLPEHTSLYVTYGKDDYYQIKESLTQIDQAIPVFVNAQLSPWYAQAILLIESPGYSRVSNTGARGAFQLMRSVALREGLTISDTLDQRDDVVASAKAAAQYLRRVCIPEARQLVLSRGETPDEESLWFKLLVLHVYHAGSGNVGGALRKIPRSIKGMHLIQRLWHTHYRGFKNASQNYSQLALAANLELQAYIVQHGDQICYHSSPQSVPNQPSNQTVPNKGK